MTDFKIALLELLRKYRGEAESDKLREGVQFLTEALMELEVTEQVGAERYERTPSRRTQRNGHRARRWDTRVGTVDLRIPKLRKGSYFPSWLLEPRRRVERALFAVVQEAYVQGVSTRKVDDLVRALGLEGISKSEVSRVCAELDFEMARFRERPLEGHHAYVWLDAKAVKIREDGRVINMAAVVAVGVRESGQREVLGYDVGAAETYDFWLEFLRGLVRRGLKGVRLVISDAHEGLKQAIADVLTGATWQRSRVHFVRNVLTAVPGHAHDEVVALLATIWAQPNRDAAKAQLEQVAAELAGRFPRAAEKPCEDVLAYMAFPKVHRRRIHSTNLVERLNREIGRRLDVVGVLPNMAAAIRLLGAVLVEQHDDWAAARNYFSAASMALIEQGPEKEGSSAEAAYNTAAAD